MLEIGFGPLRSPLPKFHITYGENTQIDLQYYTAPPNFDFCLKDCTIGQQYSVRNAVRLAIGRIIAANSCDTEACAPTNTDT